MKRAMQIICVIFALVFLAACAQPFVLASGGNNAEESELISVSDGIIKWKKHSMGISEEDFLLCEKFTALAGTSSGDWYPIGLSGLEKDDNYIGYPIQLLPDDRVVVINGWYETTAAINSQPALVTIDMTAYLNGSTDYTPIEMYTGK